jgi:hypothetical protein
VIVRPVGSDYGLANHLRITVGNVDRNERKLLQAAGGHWRNLTGMLHIASRNAGPLKGVLRVQETNPFPIVH